MTHVSELAIAFISVGYLAFAVSIWVALWRNGTFLSRASIPAHSLAAVFVLCLSSGYASTLLPEEWVWAREPMHWTLGLITVYLPFSGVADWLAKRE